MSETAVPGGIITLEYALEGLNWLTPGVEYVPANPLSARDADLVTYIVAATPVIESIVGPVLPVSKTIHRDGGKSGIPLPGHIASAAAVTAVTVGGAALSDFVVDEEAGILFAGAGLAFEPGLRNVAITFTTGYNPIPAGLKLAAREFVVANVQLGKQALNSPADPGGIDQSVQETTGHAIPRRVYELCRPFVRPGFA